MRLVLLGSPVSHSLSPAIHNAALKSTDIAGRYAARDVDVAGFDAAMAEVRAGDLSGANVTMPYKARAHDACDELSEEASRAGAVNTVAVVGAGLVGHNTDVIGVRRAWEARGLPEEGPIMILGAGGAAAAALLAVEGRPVFVAARSPEAAQRLIERTEVAAEPLLFGTNVPEATVVNATPLGMNGENLPESVLEGCAGLLEMAYGAGETPAEREVSEHGKPVSSGIDMLVHQAAASFRIWTGVEGPVEVMYRAARAMSPRA